MAYGWPKTLHKAGKRHIAESEADEIAALREGWKHVADDLAAPDDAPPSASDEALVEAAKQVAKFDHDGDGKPGGSKPKAVRKPRRKAK